MVVTRDHAIPLLKNVCIAAITSTVRDLPTEVPVGREQGLRRDAVVNCDNLFTVPKRSLETRRGALGPEQLDGLRASLRIALDLI